MTNEILSKPRISKAERERKIARDRLMAGAAIALTLVGGAIGSAYGFSKMADYPSTTVEIPETHSEDGPTGTVDPSIDAVLAFEGAEARSMPYFADVNSGDPDNVISQIENEDGLYMKAPDHDVLVKSDPNNKLKWFGVEIDGKTEWYNSDEAVAIRKE